MEGTEKVLQTTNVCAGCPHISYRWNGLSGTAHCEHPKGMFHLVFVYTRTTIDEKCPLPDVKEGE